jgi:hypothetical protein
MVNRSKTIIAKQKREEKVPVDFLFVTMVTQQVLSMDTLTTAFRFEIRFGLVWPCPLDREHTAKLVTEKL